MKAWAETTSAGPGGICTGTPLAVATLIVLAADRISAAVMRPSTGVGVTVLPPGATAEGIIGADVWAMACVGAARMSPAAPA